MPSAAQFADRARRVADGWCCRAPSRLIIRLASSQPGPSTLRPHGRGVHLCVDLVDDVASDVDACRSTSPADDMGDLPLFLVRPTAPGRQRVARRVPAAATGSQASITLRSAPWLLRASCASPRPMVILRGSAFGHRMCSRQHALVVRGFDPGRCRDRPRPVPAEYSRGRSVAERLRFGSSGRRVHAQSTTSDDVEVQWILVDAEAG